MAQIEILTTPADQLKVLQYLRETHGATIAVSKIAKDLGMLQSKVRYVIEDLVAQGRLERVPTKAFNKHYIRYGYNVISNEPRV